MAVVDSSATASAPAAVSTGDNPAGIPAQTADAEVPFGEWIGSEEALAQDPPAAEPAAPAKPEIPVDGEEAETGQEDAPDAANTDEEGQDEPDAADVETDDTKEPAAEAPVIEFTPDEKFEDFEAKVDQFFEAYDVDPAIVAIRDGFTREVNTLKTQLQEQVELVAEVRPTVEAVAALNEFRKDETGSFVPKTNELVSHVKANFPEAVYKRLVFDVMNAPSSKYGHLGFSQLHELYVDAGVDPRRMDEFVKYVSGEAEMPPVHADMPAGVPSELAEAYAKNGALRKIIDETAEKIAWDDDNKRYYAEEYATAKSQYDDAITALKAQQNDYNRDRQEKIDAKNRIESAKIEHSNKVLLGVQSVQVSEIQNFGKDLDAKLAAFIPDTKARALEVLKYEQTIINAMADDWSGEYTRQALKAQGITLDVPKARALLKQVEEAVEKKEIILAQTGDEKRAAKGVERELTEALRELGVIRRRAVGQLAQIAAKSYTTGMKPLIPAEEGKKAPGGEKPSIRPTLKGGKGSQARTHGAVDFTNAQEAGKYYASVLFNKDE